MTKTWTGKDVGVRKPRTGETPLSAAEVGVGLRDGAFAPKPSRKHHWTIGWGDAAKGILSLAEKAKEAGFTWKDINTAFPNWQAQTASGALSRHLAAGTLIRRGKGGLIRYWLGAVSAEVADAIHAQDCERARQRRVDKRREYSDRHRRAVGNMTRAEYVAHQKARAEAAKSQKARERVERATARKLEQDAKRAAAKALDAQARAAIRKEKAEARKLEEQLAAQERKAAAEKAKAKAGKKITRATKAINRIADKYRGTTAPSIVPMPQARPKAAPVEIPPHLVTVCRPMTLPHERIQPTGEIAKQIGRYSAEASTWAKAVAA